MSTAGSASGPSARRMSAGSSIGKSPCTLTTIPARSFRIGERQSLEDAIRARGVIAASHHGTTARGGHGGGDFRGVGRDRDRPDRGFLRPAHHADDHRHAADVGQRLARQAGRSHARRDQDQDVGIHAHRRLEPAPTVITKMTGFGAGYTGCQRGGKPAMCRPAVPLPAPIPPNSRLEEPSRDGLLRNQQDPGRFAVHVPVPAVAQHRRRGDVRAAQAGKARVRGGGHRAEAGRRRAARPRSRSRSRSCWPPPRSRRARPRPRNARPAIPSARASRTGSGRTSTAWSGASAAGIRDSIIRPA